MRFLLNESYNECAFRDCRETVLVNVVIVAHTLARVATDKKYISNFVLLASLEREHFSGSVAKADQQLPAMPSTDGYVISFSLEKAFHSKE